MDPDQLAPNEDVPPDNEEDSSVVPTEEQTNDASGSSIPQGN